MVGCHAVTKLLLSFNFGAVDVHSAVKAAQTVRSTKNTDMTSYGLSKVGCPSNGSTDNLRTVESTVLGYVTVIEEDGDPVLVGGHDVVKPVPEYGHVLVANDVADVGPTM